MDFTPSQPPSEDPLAPETVQLPPSAQVSAQEYRRHFFYGIFGLRAIWSLLIYFALLGIMGGGLFAIVHEVHQHHHAATAAAAAAAKTGKPASRKELSGASAKAHQPEPMSAMIFGEGILFLILLLASWVMGILEHRRFAVFGLGGEHPVNRCFIGAFWGILAISLLIFLLHSLHLLVFDSRLDHGGGILYWGLLQLFAFLLVGLTEEYTMRGYLQFTLTRGLVSIGNLFSPRHARTIGFWIAAVITSALFFLAHTHNHGEDHQGLLMVFVAGMVFVIALWRTGSLWWGIGFHMAWDWGQSFLYGVPDSGGLMQGRLFATHAVGKPLLSGGSVGPEGSIFCMPVLLLPIVVLFFTRRSQQPPLETDV